MEDKKFFKVAELQALALILLGIFFLVLSAAINEKLNYDLFCTSGNKKRINCV